MGALKVEIPEVLERETGRIEMEVKELVSEEEKRKRLSMFIDELMKGAKQLSGEELIKFGRKAKKGRSGKLKQMGLV